MTLPIPSITHASNVLKEYPEVKKRVIERENFWRGTAGGFKESMGVQTDTNVPEQERILMAMDKDPQLNKDRSFVEQVDKALEGLPQIESDLLALSHFDNVPIEEVAKSLGIAVSTYFKKQNSALLYVARKLFGVFA